VERGLLDKDLLVDQSLGLALNGKALVAVELVE
jgi:hypothetical protein